MRLFTIHHRGTPRKAKPLDHGSERASSGALGEARRRHSHAALCDAAFDFGKHKGKSFRHVPWATLRRRLRYQETGVAPGIAPALIIGAP